MLGVSSMLGEDAQVAAGLAEHGLEVGGLAERLVTTGPAPALRTAALLHDIGRLGFAVVAPTEYQALIDGCGADEGALAAAEIARFGGDHAQCGGFLLGLWGLPQEVVDLVSRHHEPLTAAGPQIGPLEALQLAELATTGRLAAWVDAAVDPELRIRRAALAARTQPPQERPNEAARHATLH
jgi:putative nucleotidyltransferase with HDIG domain